ncbi:MAG: shikimate dehydrogenase [Hyphomicrobiaceae bacterium]|nr:shikimate dehydrogenase [Hyphomicrobiaceae bacterium]
MRKACVIGWPITHSRSPMIHGYWLKSHGIDGSYEKVAVQPENARAFLLGLEAGGFSGCNVTVPLKEIAFEAAQEKEASAIAVGAANTIWLEGGKICAANTDTYGFMTHLGKTVPDWQERDRPVLVLGAGGAARAIVYGFIESGVGQVLVANRTRARAEALSQHFGRKVKVVDWGARSEAARDAGVIVNTTTIGMKNEGSLDMDFRNAADSTVVADIVYVPLETEMLAVARKRGLRTVDGLGMLLHQAVPGFEKWFGVRPEVTGELRAMIVADLEKAA